MTDQSFYEQNRTFKLYYENSVDSYEIVSAFLIDIYADDFHYEQNLFVDQAAKDEWISQEEDQEWIRKNLWNDNNAADSTQIILKNVRDSEEGKMVIDHFRSGAVCIFRMCVNSPYEERELMSYIDGALYALDGELIRVGENVYMTGKR